LLQAIAQVPQLVDRDRSVSQPFVMSWSQSAKPVLQTGAHRPSLQLVSPCAFEHALAQLPQLWPLVAALVSQPLACVPSQSA
jgi:hypothetical protein